MTLEQTYLKAVDLKGKISQDIFRDLMDSEIVAVNHAHWIEIYGGYICSNCGMEFSTILPFCTRDRSMPKFCLHCGAKMDEVME